MKIYQNWEIKTEEDLRPGTIGYSFRIKSAKIYERAVGIQNSLLLNLKKDTGNKNMCTYGLIGEELQEEFKKDMKVSKIEELVGKKIIGFVHEKEPALQGLRVMNQEKT
jgi:hypothetical protein